MARSFNGIADVAVSNTSVGYQQTRVSISFWLKATVDKFPANAVVLVYDQPGFPQDGALWIQSSSAIGAGVGFVSFCNVAGTKFWQDSFPAPSLNVWHHYLYVANQTTPSHLLWIDGAPVVLGAAFTRHDAPPFDHFKPFGQFYVGAATTGPATFPQGMVIAELGIEDAIYTQRQATSLAAGASVQDQPQDLAANYWPFVAGESPEPRWNGPDFATKIPVNLALTGTAYAAHPPNVRVGIRGRLMG